MAFRRFRMSPGGQIKDILLISTRNIRCAPSFHVYTHTHTSYKRHRKECITLDESVVYCMWVMQMSWWCKHSQKVTNDSIVIFYSLRSIETQWQKLCMCDSSSQVVMSPAGCDVSAPHPAWKTGPTLHTNKTCRHITSTQKRKVVLNQGIHWGVSENEQRINGKDLK